MEDQGWGSEIEGQGRGLRYIQESNDANGRSPPGRMTDFPPLRRRESSRSTMRSIIAAVMSALVPLSYLIETGNY